MQAEDEPARKRIWYDLLHLVNSLVIHHSFALKTLSLIAVILAIATMKKRFLKMSYFVVIITEPIPSFFLISCIVILGQYSRGARNMNCKARLPGFQSWLCCFLDVWNC